MKKFLFTAAAASAMTVGAATLASAITINDTYIGGENVSSPLTSDVFGSEETYGVSYAEVNLVGSNLVVDIHTQYLDNIGAGGTVLGDLFLSTDPWNPVGSSPYLGDYFGQGNEEDWEYALVFDNHHPSGTTTNGSVGLYSVNDANIVLSSDVFSDPMQRRGDQEVQYDTTGQTVAATGSWEFFNLGGSDTDDFLRFTIDSSSIANFNIDDRTIRWSMTCANDIIEGSTAGHEVPEPMTMILFGTGLVGLAGSTMRTRKKQ